jgi:hypothetical protein
MIVRAPFVKPDAPILAMARAMISILDDWAPPQRPEPNSKMARKTRKVAYWKLASFEMYLLLHFIPLPS